MLAREGLRRSGEAGDGHGKAREARILQIRWRSACGGRRRATQPWKLLLSEEKIQRSSEGKQGKKRDRREMVGAHRPEENLRFGSKEARKRAGPAGEVQGGIVVEEDWRGLEAGLRQLGVVQQVGDGRLRLRDTGSRRP